MVDMVNLLEAPVNVPKCKGNTRLSVCVLCSTRTLILYICIFYILGILEGGLFVKWLVLVQGAAESGIYGILYVFFSLSSNMQFFFPPVTVLFHVVFGR